MPTTLRFGRSDGTTITIDRATLEQRKAQSLARQVALLGNTWSTAYRIGPHPELIGRATAALPALPRERISAVVTDVQPLAHVEPDSGYLPSHIAGTLNGADPDGRELAFALNGRVVSTGRTFRRPRAPPAQLLDDAATQRLPSRPQPHRHLPDQPRTDGSPSFPWEALPTPEPAAFQTEGTGREAATTSGRRRRRAASVSTAAPVASSAPVTPSSATSGPAISEPATIPESVIGSMIP